MGVELFRRAADAGGRILRAERLPDASGATDPGVGSAYLLSFDVGRILVSADVPKASLVIEQIESRDQLGDDFEVLDEAEPWWRVIGCPITRVWPEGSAGEDTAPDVDQVRLQFRADTENPKIIALRFATGRVHVAIEGER